MRRLILSFFALMLLGFSSTSFAGVIDLPKDFQRDMEAVSIKPIAGETTLEKVETGGMRVLHIFKIIINGLAIIMMVYAGAQMVLSVWFDEKSVTAAKKQMYIALTAFLFVNVPGQLYELFSPDAKNISVTDKITTAGYTAAENTSNLFINFNVWKNTVENGVVQFLKVGLLFVAILMLIIGGVQLIMSKGDEKVQKNAKTKFVWGIGSLVLLGFIEAWFRVVYSGNIQEGQGIFAKVANLALFFAGPVAIFFLIFGAYLFITSAGDEEKAKKGKIIVVNTVIATLLLLACYTFLKDLAGLTF